MCSLFLFLISCMRKLLRLLLNWHFIMKYPPPSLKKHNLLDNSSDIQAFFQNAGLIDLIPFFSLWICLSLVMCYVYSLRCILLIVTTWTVAHQFIQSMEILQPRTLEWVAMSHSGGGGGGGVVVVIPTQGLNPGFPHCRQILYHLT